MTPAAVSALFRHEVADAVAPYLWTKSEVDSYLDDAQRLFCRLTGGLRDNTSDATLVNLVTGVGWVDLHPSILLVRGAVLVSTGRPIDVYNYDDLYGVQAVPRALPFTFSQIEAQGTVKALIIGLSENQGKIVQVPAADDQLRLMVERLPLKNPSIPNGKLEIREEHHRHLVLWMKHLAYGKQDADTFDRGRADMYEQEFYRYCAAANAEKERSQHKPRLINYGGL